MFRFPCCFSLFPLIYIYVQSLLFPLFPLSIMMANNTPVFTSAVFLLNNTGITRADHVSIILCNSRVCIIWLCAELGCQPSATGLFRLLPLVSGTICHSTSRLQNLCLSSAVASRLISLGAAFRDTFTVVVPEKWLCHSGHVNRFCYLLYDLTMHRT